MLKRCEICGKDFETTNNKRTCSEECKIELKVRTLKRQWEKIKEKSRTGRPVGRPKKAHKEHIYKPTKNDTLCWTCQNATGGCSWSKKLKPVEGWTAEVRNLKFNENGEAKYDKSYKVIKCPHYIQDEPRQ